MSVQNLVSAQLAPADKAAIIAAFQTVKNEIPFGILLTSEERQKGFKLGTGNTGFMQKVMKYAASRPDLVPSFVNMPEAQKDVSVAADLSDILIEAMPVISMIEDTYQQAGVEALASVMSIYNNIKAAVKNGVPGAQEIYNDLKQEFHGGKSKETPSKPGGNPSSK